MNRLRTAVVPLGVLAALGVAALVFRAELVTWFRGDAKAAVAADPDVAYYTCPMHPSVHQDHDGTCPICGMELVPVPVAPDASGEIRIDADRRDVIGVKTELVIEAPMTLDLRAVGRLTYDERGLTDVTLKVGGFITDLRVAATGQKVSKGQVLFTLYSPELFAAQQDYLLARASQTGARGEALARATETRLRLWGLSDKQLAAIVARGEPIESLPFASPASGYVIEKDVVEGASVEAGERLFRIAALDRIWVEAEVFERDLARVHVGDAADVTLDYQPGAAYAAEVTFVYPYLDPATRTGRVRLELPNHGLALKPDMYATVTFHVALGDRVQVPTAAVIYTGPRRVVFVDLGDGRMRPQDVTIGAQTPLWTEVLSGVKAGDVVVTSGNFLVAAESRLRSTGAAP